MKTKEPIIGRLYEGTTTGSLLLYYGKTNETYCFIVIWTPKDSVHYILGHSFYIPIYQSFALDNYKEVEQKKGEQP